MSVRDKTNELESSVNSGDKNKIELAYEQVFQLRNDKQFIAAFNKTINDKNNDIPMLKGFHLTGFNPKGDMEFADDTGRSIQMKKNGEIAQTSERPQLMEYDKDNKMIRYTAPDGEIFENRGENTFKSMNNPVAQYSEISIDEKTRAVTIKDGATGHTVTRTVDGVETVQYKDAGKTETTYNDNLETIKVSDKNRDGTRKLVLENDEKGAKLKEYTDRNGIVYERTNEKMTTNDKGEVLPEYKQRPIFVIRDSNNNVVGKYTIEADRSGNVCIRKWHEKPEEFQKLKESPEFAKRELNNGTIVTSDSEGNRRLTKTANGVSISERVVKDKDKDIDERIKTITYSNNNASEVTYSRGELTKVITKVDGQETVYTRNPKTLAGSPDEFIELDNGWTKNQDGVTSQIDGSIQEKHGQITISQPNDLKTVLKQDGTMLEAAGCVDEPKDPKDSTIIQKAPRKVDLDKNIEDAENHRVDRDYLDVDAMPIPVISLTVKPGPGINNMYRFKDLTNYGREWDFKTPGGEYINHTEYEMYGNWHLGVVAAASGFSKECTLRESGRAQQGEKTSKPEWGNPGIWHTPIGASGSYGDDPRDAEQIKNGYDWYMQNRKKQAA